MGRIRVGGLQYLLTCIALCVPTGYGIVLAHFERNSSSIMETKLYVLLEVDSDLRKEKLIHLWGDVYGGEAGQEVGALAET